MSPASAGGFLTTAPPGKSLKCTFLNGKFLLCELYLNKNECANSRKQNKTKLKTHIYGGIPKKQSISQFLPGRGMTAYFHSCCLRVWLPISLHLRLNVILPFGILKGLVTLSQLLGITKNNEDSLDNHKVLRGSQEPS